jgi:N-acetylmuramoyl-L-alanine amidase
MRLIADYLFGVVTVFQEAEGEPYEGKVAVAEVILRRMRRKYMSDGTVVGTCLRRLQFSGWNSDSANRIRSLKIDTSNPVADECVRAWVEADKGSDLVPDCLHYFNARIVSPPWAKDAEIVAVIGNHTFVKVKE